MPADHDTVIADRSAEVRARRVGSTFRPCVALVALIAIAACADSNVADRPIHADDGIVEVTNDDGGGWTDADADAWRLEEDLRIGEAAVDSENRPEQFGLIGALTVDSKGRIYVFDWLAREIRVFDPDGIFSHTIGRHGAGPGEFEGPRGTTYGGQIAATVENDGGIWFARTREYRVYRRNLSGDTTLIFSLPAAGRIGAREMVEGSTAGNGCGAAIAPHPTPPHTCWL